MYPFFLLAAAAPSLCVALEASEIELKLTINYDVRVLYGNHSDYREIHHCHSRWCCDADEDELHAIYQINL